MDETMRLMAANWWLILLRGIAAILFGIVTLIWPGLTVFALLLVFGAYAIFDGALTLVTAFQRRNSDERWWAWALDGLLSITIGVMALFWTGPTALAFIIWMAIWGVIAGIFRIVAAIRLRNEIDGEWALGLSGLLLLIWGILMATLPAAGLLSIAWLIGTFALLIGISLIVLSFHLRKLKTA
ncbi:HdeD family acid-resistance protein [Paracoccus aestuariivivens]|uniref:HdeD family acid-resistance protein n=1 Tax=Paracoccus aestuariivivens TaxID=1820333 RepID=A0A6L6J940_9RHOB|nr:HdeD family acid-resistance protein [Paracoccus aestuariivivens]MTH77665.1 HdeD family acid-resistance protein [Paracoccus aestuariivivens]